MSGPEKTWGQLSLLGLLPRGAGQELGGITCRRGLDVLGRLAGVASPLLLPSGRAGSDHPAVHTSGVDVHATVWSGRLPAGWVRSLSCLSQLLGTALSLRPVAPLPQDQQRGLSPWPPDLLLHLVRMDHGGATWGRAQPHLKVLSSHTWQSLFCHVIGGTDTRPQVTEAAR